MTKFSKTDVKKSLQDIQKLETKGLKKHELHDIKQFLKSAAVQDYAAGKGQNFFAKLLNQPFRQALRDSVSSKIGTAISELKKETALADALKIANKSFYASHVNTFNTRALAALKTASQKTEKRLDQKTTGDRFTSQKRVSAKYQAPVPTKD